MKTVEIIRKKRDNIPLNKKEIDYLIQGYVSGKIPDYQMSAFAMAIYYQGMNEVETAQLTMAMVKSGEQVNLSAINGIKVDKHSTGGVGDTTTLILAPLVAAAGVPVAKLSGRGLGHTGGTIDKLESINGFSTELTIEEFVQRVNESQVAVIGQTADLTPADKQLYALRDVTATVESIPLIASSIMSKKIAAGADAIVLDVKTGQGAFMKDEDSAIQLAKAMVAIGKHVGRKTIAVVSDMSQPLGFAVGNSIEVQEAIDTLQGKGPHDLTELSLELGAQMLLLSGRTETAAEARELLEKCIQDGSAYQKWLEFVQGQGGDVHQLEDRDVFTQSSQKIVLTAPKAGYIQSIQAEEVGLCAMKLGAGRCTKEDVIDHSVGVLLHKKVADFVNEGEPLATLYVNETRSLESTQAQLLDAIMIRPEEVSPPDLIRCIVTEDGVRTTL